MTSNVIITKTTEIKNYRNPYTDSGCGNNNENCRNYFITTDCAIDLYHGKNASQIIYVSDKYGNPVDVSRIESLDLSMTDEFECEVLSTSGNGIEYESNQKEFTDKKLFEINNLNFYSKFNDIIFDAYGIKILNKDSLCGSDTDAIQLGTGTMPGQIFLNPISYNSNLYVEIIPDESNTGSVTCFVNGLPQPVNFNEKTKLINAITDCEECVVNVTSYDTAMNPTIAKIKSISLYTDSGIANKGQLKLYYQGNNIPKIAGQLKGSAVITFKKDDSEEKGQSYVINCISIANVVKTNKTEYECLGIEKITDYTYKFEDSYLDYDYAIDYYNGDIEIEGAGMCSSVKKGNFYGRNFDWIYSDNADFIVTTPNRMGRYATIGFGCITTKITDKFVESGKYSDIYKILPFKIVDGMNETGLVANTNVVPTQLGETTGTIPEIETKHEMCNMMLVRFVLDNFSSAKDAAEYIRDYVSVFNYESLGKKYGYDLHMMIGDKECAYLVEFINNRTIITDISSKAIMTNFHLHGVRFNANGSVYTPYDKDQDPAKDPIYVNNITSHGSGLERYNLINKYYDSLNTEQDMLDMMDRIKYTNLYKDGTRPKWYTEGVGVFETYGDVRINSDLKTLDKIYLTMQKLYENRDRKIPSTWQTIHSCVYDLDKKKVCVIFQENNKKYVFAF